MFLLLPKNSNLEKSNRLHVLFLSQYHMPVGNQMFASDWVIKALRRCSDCKGNTEFWLRRSKNRASELFMATAPTGWSQAR